MKGEEEIQNVSPVLQLVHAGVGRTADTGDLLPLLPLRQLLGYQVGQQRLGDVQEVGQLDHHVLEEEREDEEEREEEDRSKAWGESNRKNRKEEVKKERREEWRDGG